MRRRLMIFALSIVACISEAYALDGDADPSFGDGGQVTIKRPHSDMAISSSQTGDLALLADGRYLWIAPLSDGSIWVGRAFRDGTPDTTFGSDGSGHVRLTDCTAPSAANLVVEPDGGAVVWTGACLLRLRADGSVDASFGAGPQPAAGLLSAGLVRDAFGRYVLAGGSATPGRGSARDAGGGEVPAGDNVRHWLVYRFDTNGVADATFGSGGMVDVAVSAADELRQLRAVAVRADGRIVTAGQLNTPDGIDMVIAQLRPDGSLDPSWNTNGIVDIATPDASELSAYAAAIDADGSLVVAGRGRNGVFGCCLLLARFDAAGQLVADFGLRVFDSPGSGEFVCCLGQRDTLALLPNQRIVVTTTLIPGDVSVHRTQYAVLRTFANGEVDPTFGHDGAISFSIADPDAAGQSGDYNFGHAAAYDRSSDSLLIFGYTFFEDNSLGNDYVSFVRSRFDLIFSDGLDD